MRCAVYGEGCCVLCLWCRTLRMPEWWAAQGVQAGGPRVTGRGVDVQRRQGTAWAGADRVSHWRTRHLYMAVSPQLGHQEVRCSIVPCQSGGA